MGSEPESRRPQRGTVLIVEDESVLARQYSRVLERAGFACIFAARLSTARRLVEDELVTVDVAVLDLLLPDGFGAELAAPLLDRDPPAISIVLTGREDRSAMLHVAHIGVHDFLVKPVEAKEFVAVVEDAYASTLRWRKALREAEPRPTRSYRAGIRSSIERELTPMQRQTLARLRLGESNAEIGGALGISPETAKHHVSAILKAFGVKRRSQIFAAERECALRDEDEQTPTGRV